MDLVLVSSFANRLKEALGELQANQLAEYIGLSKQAISMYTSGKRIPKQPTIKVIAEQLNVNEAWLMGYDVPKTRAKEIKNQTLSKFECDMIQVCNKLNKLGKQEALKRVEELTYIDKYVESDISEPNSISTSNISIAAHNGKGYEKHELAQEDYDQSTKELKKVLKKQ